jgi:uncharacterized membrane protein
MDDPDTVIIASAAVAATVFAVCCVAGGLYFTRKGKQAKTKPTVIRQTQSPLTNHVVVPILDFSRLSDQDGNYFEGNNQPDDRDINDIPEYQQAPVS